jgi:hypothetical protein
MRLWLDLETYSGVPITHGAHATALPKGITGITRHVLKG